MPTAKQHTNVVTNHMIRGEISVSYSSEHGDGCLLGCCAMYSGKGLIMEASSASRKS